MRKNGWVTSKSTVLTLIVSGLILAGAVAGCGDGDSSPATGTTASGSTTGPAVDPAGTKDTGKAPASAGDDSKGAPDNSISDRPGGPADKGQQDGGGNSVSSGLEGPPVNPEPPK